MEEKPCKQCGDSFVPQTAASVNCHACRKYNVERKQKSRERQALARGVDVDAWVGNFDSEYPDIAHERREHSKQFRATVSQELQTPLPWEVIENLDCVAELWLAIQNERKPGWIQKVTDLNGLIYAGIHYPDVTAGLISKACAAHSLDKSDSFRKKYVDVLAHLEQKFSGNVNHHDPVLADNAKSVKSELARLAK